MKLGYYKGMLFVLLAMFVSKRCMQPTYQPDLTLFHLQGIHDPRDNS